MIRALLVALLLALLAGAWQWREATAAKARANVAANERDAFREAFANTQAARAEERRRTDQIQEALDAAHHARLAAEADARRADAAAVGLRQRAQSLAAAARRPAEGAAAACSCEAAGASADLLAELSSRIDQAAGELADFAQQAHIAGQLCQRSYGALTPR